MLLKITIYYQLTISVNTMTKPEKKRNITVKVIGSIILLGLIIGGIIGFNIYSKTMKPNINSMNKDVFIFIPPQSNMKDISNLIQEKGIFNNQQSFEWVAEKKNYKGKNIVPGKYKISDGWSNNDLINHLRAGNGRLDVSITFNQIRDLQQLSGALSKSIMIDSASVYQYISDPKTIQKYGFNKQTFISMFVPNTYYVQWHISKEDLIKRMANEYKSFWTTTRKNKLKRSGLTQSEIVTMASIVYWETKIPKDKKTIAGVYMNRIRKGMPLQADPTLIFASGDYSINRVLDKHKQINSPYNTYKNRGLPPGPILIPPISYIDAVLDFEKHKYLYFVAKEDFSGESYFSKTYTQHLNYARRYQKALNKRKIYR